MTVKSPFVLILAIAVAAGCARRESDDTASDASQPSSSDAPAEPQISGADAPKVVAPITVALALTPEARAALAGGSGSLSIEAVYVGDPTPEASAQANEFGVIELGRVQSALASPDDTVGFEASAVDTGRLDLVVGQPQIMLNVRSPGPGSTRNLLACDFYWESVKTASEGVVTIPCRPMGESTAD